MLAIGDIIVWASTHDTPYARTGQFEFVMRTIGPTICPKVRDHTDQKDTTVVNWLGWARDCPDAQTVAAWHVFGRGGELHEPMQIARPGPRHRRPTGFMLNDCPIVLNDPILEELLSKVHGFRGGLLSRQPRRVPFPEHVQRSSENAHSFDVARCIAGVYRRLITHHPDVRLREPAGRQTFAAGDLADRFRDQLDWDDVVAIGSVQRPSTTRGSVYGERDFRVRQFVSLMRSEILFGMERQQAVALATRITEAFPGRFRLSEPTIEAILDRRTD